MSSLPKFYLNEQFSDVTINLITSKDAQVKKFPAHKVVLCQNSLVFETMFNVPMKETVTSMIELKNVEEKTVLLFLKYLYFGRFDISPIESMENLLGLAMVYEVLDLVKYIFRKEKKRYPKEPWSLLTDDVESFMLSHKDVFDEILDDIAARLGYLPGIHEKNFQAYFEVTQKQLIRNLKTKPVVAERSSTDECRDIVSIFKNLASWCEHEDDERLEVRKLFSNFMAVLPLEKMTVKEIVEIVIPRDIVDEKTLLILLKNTIDSNHEEHGSTGYSSRKCKICSFEYRN